MKKLILTIAFALLTSAAYAGPCEIYIPGSATGTPAPRRVQYLDANFKSVCIAQASTYSQAHPGVVYNVFYYFNFIGQAFNGQFGRFN